MSQHCLDSHFPDAAFLLYMMDQLTSELESYDVDDQLEFVKKKYSTLSENLKANRKYITLAARSGLCYNKASCRDALIPGIGIGIGWIGVKKGVSVSVHEH